MEHWDKWGAPCGETVSRAPGFSRQASPLWKEISSTARKQACIRDLERWDKWGAPCGETVSMTPGFSRQASPLWKEISSTARKQACIRDLQDCSEWGGNLRGNSQYGSRLLPTGKPALEGNKQYRSQASLYQ